jgi:hypothetical protein
MLIDDVQTGRVLWIKIIGVKIKLEATVCEVDGVLHKFAELNNGEEIFHYDIEWYETRY